VLEKWGDEARNLGIEDDKGSYAQVRVARYEKAWWKLGHLSGHGPESQRVWHF
jgi:hypothetical protein